MDIQFKEALLYPFREENRRDIIWIPAGLIYAVCILEFVVGMAVLIPIAVGGGSEQLIDLVLNLLNITGSLLQSLLSIVFLGYFWMLCGRWQQHGLHASALPWMGHWRIIAIDGLKSLLYVIPVSVVIWFVLGVIFIILIVLLILSVMAYGENLPVAIAGTFLSVLGLIAVSLVFNIFITPFLAAPMIVSARSRQLSDLFNLPQAVRMTRLHYKACLIAMLYIIAVNILYGVAIMLLAITIIGLLVIPALVFPMYASTVHLLTQAFGDVESIDI